MTCKMRQKKIDIERDDSQILTEDLLEEAMQPVTPALNSLGYFGVALVWWILSELYNCISVPGFSSTYLSLPQISALSLM